MTKVVNPIDDMSSWDIFAFHYGIHTQLYHKFQELVKEIEESNGYFPILFLPHKLSHLSKEKFSISTEADTPISFKYLVKFEKEHHLETTFFEIPNPSKRIRIPEHKIISNEIEQSFKRLNYLNLSKILLIPLLAVLLNMLFGIKFEDVLALSILISLAFLPFIQDPDFWLKNSKRIITISDKEKLIRQNESDYVFNQEFEVYKREINKYHKNIKERLQEYQQFNIPFNKFSLEVQQQLSPLIAYLNIDLSIEVLLTNIIKYYCKSNGILTLDNNPPFKGKAEDLLFYKLYEKYPNCIFVNRRIGIYYPDIILSVNDCLIDIEVD